MLNDTLANTMSALLQDEKLGKIETTVRPASTIIKRVLDVFRENGYVQSYEVIEDGRGNVIKIKLAGTINKCGVIKPRFSVKVGDYERFEKRYLLARNMGILVVSTPSGIMTHEEARKKKSGGKLLAYCY